MRWLFAALYLLWLMGELAGPLVVILWLSALILRHMINHPHHQHIERVYGRGRRC